MSKYAPFLVSHPRDKMSRFVTGVSDYLKEECRSAMLHGNMNISCLMVHAQQGKEARVERKSNYSNRAKSFLGGSSKGRLYIQDNPRFKKRFYNQLLYKFPKDRDDRVSNPTLKNGRVTSSLNKMSTVEIFARITMLNAL